MNAFGEHAEGSTELIINQFRSFRDELLKHYGSAEYERKENHSQVTEFDIRIEKSIRQALADAYPEFGFLGEETGDGRRENAPYWVLDPIDATSSFIRGLPNCVNMAALIVDDQPVVSVLYDFVNDILYTAKRGEGAYRNGERLHVSNRPLDGSAVYLHRGFILEDARRDAALDAHVEMYRPFGASGKAYILIAEGKIEAYMLYGSRLSIHDNAPGALLALEAGAMIQTKSGEPWSVNTSDFMIGTRPVVTFFTNPL
jgi:fructose-1,6-bisphosphatase/inositol monophosphatase family enzyme